MRKLTLLCLLFSFIFVPVLAAQSTDDVAITFPPPVSLVSGIVSIEGSANLPNQSLFFIQYRELDDTLAPIGGEDALWSPATPLRRDQVVDGELGLWDTTTVDDGIYQLQLVVNRTSGEPTRATVSAVRVLNTDDPVFANARVFGEPVTIIEVPEDNQPIATAGLPATRSPLQPTPTSIVRATSTIVATAPANTAPSGVTVTGAVQANVRLGDSTSYPPVGVLQQGQTAPVLGQSNRSSWLFIQLPNGVEGFISPSTVTIDGDLFTLTQIQPPPLPFTPTPVPTATFTPLPVAANLVIRDIDLDPENPLCGSTFEIEATIQNIGNGPTSRSGIVNVADRELDDNDITETTIGGFPVLNAGESFRMVIPITIDENENDEHRIEITIDPANEIPETNENDNFASDEYDLAESDSC